MSEHNTQAQFIADLTRRGIEVKASGIQEFIVLGQHEKVQDLEHFQERPNRIRQNVTVVNAESFTAYFNRFKQAASIVFVDDRKYIVRGIVDYHDIDAAKWGSHSCSFGLTQTDEWQAWINNNGRRMNQLGLAEFLENHLTDIVEPVGARILEAATNLSSHRNVAFQSKVRVDNGAVQFSYIEEDNKAAPGAVEIPQQFTLGIKPFLRSEMYKMTAKLRYRIENAQLHIWYDLINPDRVIRDAFEQEVEKITTALDKDTLIIYGSA